MEPKIRPALAVAAIEEGAPTPKALRALYAIVPRQGLVYRHLRTGAINTARFSPCGLMLVVSFWRHPSLALYDAAKLRSNAVVEDREVPAVALEQGDAESLREALEHPGGVRLAILEGHSAEVFHAEFSPDGSRILSASKDGTVCIWDAISFRLVKRLDHPAPVRFATFSPDDSMLASACADGVLRIWNLESGQCSMMIEHAEELWCVRYYPHGNRIAVLASGHAAVYDLAGKLMFRIETTGAEFGEAYAQLDMSADGGRIMLTVDKTISLWDAQTGAAERKLSFWGNRSALSPEQARILVGAGSSILLCHSGDGGKLFETPAGVSTMGDVTWSPDGEWFVACGMDGLHLWEEPWLPRLIELTKAKGRYSLSDEARAAAFLPDLRPPDPETCFHRARLLANLGDWDSSLRELAWAIDAGFNDAEQVESDKYLGWIVARGEDRHRQCLKEMLARINDLNGR